MPRAFTESERSRVRERLIEAAASHFAQFGYRRASIAGIARSAGVGKGSVYLFVATKAELFMEVGLRAEAELRARLLDELQGPFTSPRERLRRYLHFQFEVLQEHPVLRTLVNPEEASAVFRDLPPGALDELRASDDAFFEGIIKAWQRDGECAPVDAAVIAALSHAIYAMSLQRALIGEAVFPQVVDLIIDSLSLRLAGEGML